MTIFFRSRNLLRATDKGIKTVASEDFMHSLQLVAMKMLEQGKSWDDVDTALRHSICFELIGRRVVADPESIAVFYSREWKMVDGCLLKAVGGMKRDWMTMQSDPVKFLQDRFHITVPVIGA
ncbi:MAG: hypothetical protein ABSE40_17495 [Candidatus Sulfotelmatobacter sp.]|jgi:hypothetical protein